MSFVPQEVRECPRRTLVRTGGDAHGRGLLPLTPAQETEMERAFASVLCSFPTCPAASQSSLPP